MEKDLLRIKEELKRREERLEESLHGTREMADELREAHSRYERLVRATNGFVYAVDLKDGRVVNVANFHGCEQVTGYTAEEYEADQGLWRRQVHPDDAGRILNQMIEFSAGASVVVIEHRIFHRDGRVRWLKNTSVARRDAGGQLVGFDGLITDITDLKRAEEERDTLNKQLRELALRDPLTGLMNRRGFEEELKRLWDLSLRHPFPIGLLMVDIDEFKALNDAYGHIVGDRVLAECARLIQSVIRGSDVVCRFGGDEITVLLPWSEANETRGVAERLLQAFRAHVFCKGAHDAQVTISIGMASVHPNPSLSTERFLSRADKALYCAKHSGRNRVCVDDVGEGHEVPDA